MSDHFQPLEPGAEAAAAASKRQRLERTVFALVLCVCAAVIVGLAVRSARAHGSGGPQSCAATVCVMCALCSL
jgi:hypothetical protein